MDLSKCYIQEQEDNVYVSAILESIKEKGYIDFDDSLNEVGEWITHNSKPFIVPTEKRKWRFECPVKLKIFNRIMKDNPMW